MFNHHREHENKYEKRPWNLKNDLKMVNNLFELVADRMTFGDCKSMSHKS